MVRAVETHPSPFVRTVLRMEIAKIIGCLRTDDSCFIGIKDWYLNKREQVITGLCTKTKSTEKTAGNTVGGMPFRLPLLRHSWYNGFAADARAMGIPHHADYVLTKSGWTALYVSPRTGQEPCRATAGDALRHLRSALRQAGFSEEVVDGAQAHTAKRSGMAILNQHTGPEALSAQDGRYLLHHRAKGRTGVLGHTTPIS